MLKLNSGVKWLDLACARAEELFVLLVVGTHHSKEQILLPWLRQRWPHWLTANILTGFRIVVSLAIIIILWLDDWQINRPVILSLLIIGILTDLFDGPVARVLHCQSSFGALIDKFADRLIIVPIGVVEFWPDYYWLIIIGVTGMVGTFIVTLINYLRTESREVPDNLVNKSAMVFFSLAIIIGLWPQWLNVGAVFAWIGVGCSVVSFGYIYTYRLYQVLQEPTNDNQ